ncbi:hypothetical protein MAP00_001248 [Monascus purpureus]|nr:hypothetical protein MAP00_001248 [Monascus purpureus]
MADDNASSAAQSPMEAEEKLVDSLVQGRARRSTAGRNMSALIDAEADDDLALLFAETEDDNEFTIDADVDVAEEDDMRLESSSEDEDDQGPNAPEDELEGEMELEKQAKADRKKRKAQEGLRLQALRKKVKIDPTAVSTSTPTPRPRKKSERISWLPTPEEGPTRSSSRRQTMQNKQITHARLKDSEEKRIRLIASMEEAAKKKALQKPKEMTQEERLAEAERVERLNSKSLNRWEEMEKRKAEERRAKIEALQNRRLEGPVMSWWSGIATWTNGVLTRLGKVDVTLKPKEETSRKKTKKAEKEKGETGQTVTNAGVLEKPSEPVPETPVPTGPDEADTTKQDHEDQQNSTVTKDNEVPAENRHLPDAVQENPTTQQTPEAKTTVTILPAQIPSFAPTAPDSNVTLSSAPQPSEAETPKDIASNQLTGQAVKESEAVPAVSADAESEKNEGIPATDAEATAMQTPEQPPGTSPGKSNLPSPSQEGKQDIVPEDPVPESSTSTQPAPSPAPTRVEPPALVSPAPTVIVSALEQDATPAAVQPKPTETQIHADQQHLVESENAPKLEAPLPAPPTIEHTGRNLIVLENFDDRTAHDHEYSIYFNSKKPPRLSSMCSFCREKILLPKDTQN